MSAGDTMKPEGTWEVRRGIVVPALSDAADGRKVESVVSEIPGVCKVAADPDEHRLIVRYDASLVAYQEILEALEGAGFSTLNDWWSRVKRRYFQYSDTGARENAKTPPPACCNRPPK